MTNVAENLLVLSKEGQELREKEKKHFDTLWDAKEGKRLAEARLEEANKKIKVGEKAWGDEHNTWDKEKVDLTTTKMDAEPEKTEAKAKVLKIQDDLDRVHFRVNTGEAQLKEAKAKASWSEE